LPLDVDALRFDGRAYRHAPPGIAPLARRDPPPDNRWQRGDVADALYLADEPATVWAEWYRHLAELGVPPRQQLPRVLWTWRVTAVVADLSDEARLARVGLPVPRPGRKGWPPFQAVGERLAGDGWAGLLAPSAARPAHHVLCLFRDQDGTRADAEPVDSAPVAEPPPPPTGMTT
jgi:RES domain-containing protein